MGSASVAEAALPDCASSVTRNAGVWSEHADALRPHWRPKGSACNRKSFPSAEQLYFDESFRDCIPLLPAPLLPLPRTPPGKGHRVRQRAQGKQGLLMEADNFLRALNHLDAGIRLNRLRTTDRRVSAASADATHWNVATAQLHARVLKLASDDARVRRSEG